MRPDISIIIPVLNEEKWINQAIEELKTQSFDGVFEIIVSDGHKDGTTLDKIKDRRVLKKRSLPGRGIQLNTGAREASGDILLFLHCDTCLPDGGLNALKQAMRNQAVCAGAFDLCINSKKNVFRMIEKSASVRSRLTHIPYGDQAVFIRRDYFFKIGGYARIPLMEDVDLMRKIKKRKGKIHILDLAVSTSARRWQKEGILYTTFRNWIILILYFCGVKPEKLVKFYQF